MRAEVLADETDFAGWRAKARLLLRNEVPPQQVAWQIAGGSADLLAMAGAMAAAAAPAPPPSAVEEEADGPPVPRRFVQLAETVILHTDPARFAVLYELLWRLTHGEPRLLMVSSDPLLRRAEMMAAAVRRDIHKMKAFVRFRAAADEAGDFYLAWFEPAHHIVEAAAPFFVRRFASMRWSILTPRRCAFWDGTNLAFAPGATRSDATSVDAVEDLWRRYYASIFNPARLNQKAMRAQMPQRYWHNLPETALIPALSRAAAARTQEMLAGERQPPAAAAVRREERTAMLENVEQIDHLRQEAAHCRACPLFEAASQTVFGEGPVPAALMLVGEQPGDQEDLAGRPFVGPAGLLLDQALRDAGLERRSIYVTNAVKHFKYVVRGKRRLHQKPTILEIRACLAWLEREIEAVRPRTIVALGATAARALTGRDLKIGASRGRPLQLDSGVHLRVTVHPSYLLRLPDEATRASEYQAFVSDLKQVSNLAPLAEMVPVEKERAADRRP